MTLAASSRAGFLLGALFCSAAALAAAPAVQAPPAPAPDTRPAALPATREDGDLQVELTRLVQGVSIHDVNRAAVGDEEPWTRADVHLRRTSGPLTGWQLDQVRLVNAAGAEWTAKQTSCKLNGKGEGFVAFRDYPDETLGPWTLDLDFARRPELVRGDVLQIFTPAELLAVPRLRVPREGEITGCRLEASQDGITVRFLGVAGPNTQMPEGLPFRHEYPSVHLRLSTPSPAIRLNLLRAIDARGNAIPRAGTAWGYGSKIEGTQAYGLKVPAGISTVDLLFAIHRSRRFEWVVQPEPAP